MTDRDRSGRYYTNDYKSDYKNDYKKENGRDFRDQSHKRRHRGYHGDKGNHRISYKNRGRNKDKYQTKNRYGDDSYDLGRSSSREKPCTYDERKDLC